MMQVCTCTVFHYHDRYSKRNGEASVDLHYIDTSNVDILKLSNVDKESYANLFASILVSHADIVKDKCIGQGETLTHAVVII